MTKNLIEALRAQAELHEGIQARWEGVRQVLDHALADGRDAVQQISKHRLELTKTDPVTRTQLAEERLLEAHAKDFQPLLTELGKAVKRAGLQSARYRELAKTAHEQADALMPPPAPTPGKFDGIDSKEAGRLLQGIFAQHGILREEPAKNGWGPLGYTVQSTGEKRPWPGSFTAYDYKDVVALAKIRNGSTPDEPQSADDFRKIFEDGLAEQFPGLAVRPLPDEAYPELRS